MRNFLGLKLPLLLAAFWGACESNPVAGDSDISKGNRQIAGNVRFNSEHAPENVFVWMEGFDISTRTDADGRFKLTLPEPEGNARQISGAFNIYYYMANYTLKSTEVFIRNGLFIFDTDEIGAQGRVRQPILLSQRLRIWTSVQPFCVSRSSINVTAGKSDFTLAVDVALQTPRDTVLVFFPTERESGNRRPLLFRDTKTNKVTVLNALVTAPVRSMTDTVTASQEIRSMNINFFPDDLPVGEYEVIPFLFIQDLPIPKGLRNRLGLSMTEPTDSYLDIPFIRFGDHRTFSVLQ